MKHDFEGGKYTVKFEGGKLQALRYGEPWRDMTGDKLVYVMLDTFDEQRELLLEAQDLLNRAYDMTRTMLEREKIVVGAGTLQEDILALLVDKRMPCRPGTKPRPL